ncbi:MAG: dephospho-CoA kinase [Verrucomicrobia bacterium]|nr:dephospho-CoA kinase [Verrucomicrobiota bacterium]MBT7026102.1 dephospho-CoA kinase [Verrucomicrobiota bacterium]
MPMIRLGLTGGIGMGKSTAAELLAKRGAKVCDSDALARELVAPGQPALAEIVEAFGSGVLVRDGSLDRAKVGKLVFGDSAAREKLEGILHPRIRKVWQARLEHWLVAGERLAVTVIPLLFETKAESSFDKIACVVCSPELQRERLRAREWSDDQISNRISAQMAVGEKIKRADHVIWTDGTIEAHAAQWDDLLSSWDVVD